MLSIKVPFLFENRVGNVICGHRLCAINTSKKSQYIIFSCIFSRFMLVSPAKIMLAFCLSIHSRTGVNSSITSLRMSLPGFGGLYKLKITVEFCRPPPDTFMTIPSQYLYVFKFITSSLSNLLSMYIIKPPFLLQDSPCEIQSYPAIWKIDRSTSSDNQVSCRQITLNLKLILLSSSIYIVSSSNLAFIDSIFNVRILKLCLHPSVNSTN